MVQTTKTKSSTGKQTIIWKGRVLLSDRMDDAAAWTTPDAMVSHPRSLTRTSPVLSPRHAGQNESIGSNRVLGVFGDGTTTPPTHSHKTEQFHVHCMRWLALAMKIKFMTINDNAHILC
jgi:hypothetical protein